MYQAKYDPETDQLLDDSTSKNMSWLLVGFLHNLIHSQRGNSNTHAKEKRKGKCDKGKKTPRGQDGKELARLEQLYNASNRFGDASGYEIAVDLKACLKVHLSDSSVGLDKMLKREDKDAKERFERPMAVLDQIGDSDLPDPISVMFHQTTEDNNDNLDISCAGCGNIGRFSACSRCQLAMYCRLSTRTL